MTTHADLIARLREMAGRLRPEAADALEALEQQVAALTNERNDLLILLDNWKTSQGVTEDQLAAAQAREAKLRGHMLNIASACRIWGGEAERARKMFEECLAIPADDSALMERLKEEREKCAMLAQVAGARNVADVIRSMK